jgi:hypothetical protein
MNHLNAIHDTAIRLNSLRSQPAFIGRSTENTEEARAFAKALDNAVGEVNTDDIMIQLSRSLGSQDKAREFVKAHVQQHFRTVNGKMVLVKDHESQTPSHHADGTPNLAYIHELGMAANEGQTHGHCDAVIAASKAARDWHAARSKSHEDGHHKMASYYDEGIDGYMDMKASLPAEAK